ncbi:MAG TPA: PLDc N-terminal domain-containing protein [Candidatus Omnitrophota bacterium]|nr:PLDc N-terminal domain-containing protein [Candidatus Omnitrophota bacterium]HRY86160.1 PLDc N-terminal domain-containing protein [Candidatus Omnitrophota bacterium]
MNTILGLIVLVLDIIAIVDCVKSSVATGKKVLWIILILILPLIGMILYFLLGKQKKAA